MLVFIFLARYIKLGTIKGNPTNSATHSEFILFVKPNQFEI